MKLLALRRLWNVYTPSESRKLQSFSVLEELLLEGGCEPVQGQETAQKQEALEAVSGIHLVSLRSD